MEFYADEPRLATGTRGFRGFSTTASSSRPAAHPSGVYTLGTTSNCGRQTPLRIDFLLCSPALAASVLGAAIDRERKGTGAATTPPSSSS